MLCTATFNQLYISFFRPCCVYGPHSTSCTFVQSMLCVWSPLDQLCISLFHPCCLYGPHSTRHTFLSSIYAVCTVPIQPAGPFPSPTLPSILFTAPFNQLHLSLFHPCCVCSPHLTNCTFLSPIHVCMAAIQPALHFSLPSMLCVWPLFNQPYFSLFHPCFVFGPLSNSSTFLSSIHVSCMAHIQIAVPFSLPSCCAYGPHSTSSTFLSSIHAVYMVPIQTAVPFSLPSMFCVWPTFNQLYLSLSHPCFVRMAPFNQQYLSSIHVVCIAPIQTSRTFLSSIHVFCIAPIEPAVPSCLPSMLCIWSLFKQPYLSFFYRCFVYGPHSTSCTFLSSIYVLCTVIIQPAVPSSLPSMLCVRTHSHSRTFLSPIHLYMAAIQAAVPFSFPPILCVFPPFNQPYLSLFHPVFA